MHTGSERTAGGAAIASSPLQILALGAPGLLPITAGLHHRRASTAGWRAKQLPGALTPPTRRLAGLHGIWAIWILPEIERVENWKPKLWKDRRYSSGSNAANIKNAQIGRSAASV